MKRLQAFTLIEVMIVVFVISILVTIFLPNLVRSRQLANDAAAKATIRALSTASEAYANSNTGFYPIDENSLTSATPPYIQATRCSQTFAGFIYYCAFDQMNYAITATPLVPGVSGSTVFTITTGGVLTP